MLIVQCRNFFRRKSFLALRMGDIGILVWSFWDILVVKFDFIYFMKVMEDLRDNCNFLQPSGRQNP